MPVSKNRYSGAWKTNVFDCTSYLCCDPIVDAPQKNNRKCGRGSKRIGTHQIVSHIQACNPFLEKYYWNIALEVVEFIFIGDIVLCCQNHSMLHLERWLWVGREILARSSIFKNTRIFLPRRWVFFPNFWASTIYFSNPTDSSATSCWFSLFLAKDDFPRVDDLAICQMSAYSYNIFSCKCWKHLCIFLHITHCLWLKCLFYHISKVELRHLFVCFFYIYISD